MKKYLLFLLTTFIFANFYGQTEFLWTSQKIHKSSNIKINKKFISNPNLFKLDINSLKTILQKSPQKNSGIAKSAVIIPFPDSEGKIQNFSVFKTSNFSPELAAKFPEIASYYGESIDGKASKIYFSVSPLGLYSIQLRLGKEAVFIETYDKENTTYIAYKKSDKTIQNKDFKCNTKHYNSAVNGLRLSRIYNADDGLLRTYRLALSCTGEYGQYFGGTKALALAAMNNTMTRVNAVFMNDFAIKMELIPEQDNIIFTDAATDPYSDATPGSDGAWSTELMTVLHGTTYGIGDNKFDVGHLFGAAGGGGYAGCIACVCNNDTNYDSVEQWYWYKGQGFTSPTDGIPYGDNFDIDYVSHELGHQFGGDHTFTYSTEDTIAQVEPGSGSTIMGYAGITYQDIQAHSDPFFHAISIQQITEYAKSSRGNCSVNTATGNTIPIANAGPDHTIPKNTPFMLTGSGSDANGDTLTYIWEEMDVQNNETTAPSATKTSGPAFRSYIPTISPTRYFPKMSSILAGSTTTAGKAITVEVLPSVTRTLKFRLTVRDNKANGGANTHDDTVVNVNSNYGPFTVTSQNTDGISYPQGSAQTITWDVANTSALTSNVDILLSTDGGNTWSDLISATPNDGSQTVNLPNIISSNCRIMVKASENIFFNINSKDFAIIPPDTQAPTAPTLTSYETTNNTITLHWSGATDNVGVTAYEIYKDGALLTTVTSSPYTVTGLSASTAYVFTVKAKDAAGNTSPASNTANVTTTATPVFTELYISEYYEGLSDNKLIEISNPTNGAISLSNYSIKKQVNGAGSWNYEMALSGTINANSTLVLRNINSSLPTCSFTSQSVPGAPLDFNGNDPVGLFKNGTLVDIVGTFNGGSGDFAADINLRRNVSVPNPTFNSSEWNSSAITSTNAYCDNIGIINPIINFGDIKNSYSEIILLPNPLKGDFLYVKNAKESSEYEIYDASGRLLSKGKLNNGSATVKSLSAGVYYLKINQIVKRFIKQ